MMPRRTIRSVLARSWQLLRANWTIVIPGLVIGVAAGILTELVSAAQAGLDESPVLASIPAAVASMLTVGVVAIVATLLSIAYTTGMANAAWQHGTATFADGWHAFTHDGRSIFVAMIGLAVLGVLAAALAPYTAFLSFVAYAFFCIYTMPAAVVGGRRGLEAIRESARIAYVRAMPTLVMVVAIVAIAAAMAVVGELAAVAPFVGPVLAAVMLQAVVAYVTLVVVGEYVALRAEEGLPSEQAAGEPRGGLPQ
jgi:hypothetical protein